MGYLLIGELAELVKCKPNTVRYYEQIGLLEPAKRSSNGYRLYTGESVRQLQFIRRVKQLGLSLREIRELSALAHDRNCRTLKQHLVGVIARRIEELESQASRIEVLKQLLRSYQHELQEDAESPPIQSRGCTCLGGVGRCGSLAEPRNGG